jgi:hypothetical protein
VGNLQTHPGVGFVEQKVDLPGSEKDHASVAQSRVLDRHRQSAGVGSPPHPGANSRTHQFLEQTPEPPVAAEDPACLVVAKPLEIPIAGGVAPMELQ